MKRAFLAFTLTLTILACTNHDESPSSGVMIRVTNISGYDYTNVFVNTSGGEFTFGDIPAKTSSSYHQFEFAYRYAYITVTINNKIVKWIPIDYVGEQRLSPGHYSYKLSAQQVGSDYQIDQSLVAD